MPRKEHQLSGPVELLNRQDLEAVLALHKVYRQAG